MDRIITAHTGAGIIWVKVTTESGCYGSDTIYIEPCDYSKYADMIPNTFTPNGDNDNDTWFIPWLYSVPNAKVEIFDRWGGHVFSAPLDTAPNSPELTWDGSFRGQQLQPGIFVWFADIEYTDGKVELLEGDVLLVR